MIANIIAFFATIITLVVIEISQEGQTNSWYRFCVAIFYFGIANVINQRFRYAAVGEPLSAPVLPEEGIGDVSIKGLTNQISTNSNSTLHANDHSNSGECPTAGKIVDGRLVLDRLEIEQILIDWQHFANVFELITPQPMMKPGGETRWYLVLSRNSAVFMDEKAEQVWSVEPSGIIVKRHPVSNVMTGLKIYSVDGRHEKIQRGSTNTSMACVLAWICESWEQFVDHKFLMPSDWILLAHELESGNSPQVFLRWNLPYDNLETGIKKLQQNPVQMSKLVKHINLNAVKEKLENKKNDFDQQHSFILAMESESHRRIRNIFVGISCFVVVMTFVGVWIPYCSRALAGSTALALFLICASAALAGMIWAQTRFVSKLAKLRV